MALVSLNFSRGGISGESFGVPVEPRMIKDESGAMQVNCTGGSATVVFQGRLGTDFSWMDITDGSSAYQITSGESKIFDDLPLVPFVRTGIKSATSCTATIHLMQ